MKKAFCLLLVTIFVLSCAYPVSAVITEADTVSVVGDLNGDGLVNAMDSYCLRLSVSGELSLESETCADANGDGRLNAQDSYYIRMFIAGNLQQLVPDNGKSVNRVLIGNNSISDYSILVPSDDSLTNSNLEFSAKELQKYIEEACGVYLPIVTKKGDGPSFVYALDSLDSSGELGSEGVDIKVLDGNVYLTGGTLRGCMYATYEFLERYLGFVFINDENEYVHKNQAIQISDGADYRFVPSITDRGIRTESVESVTTAIKWKNSSTKCSSGIASAKYGYGIETGSVHTMGDYTNCPNDSFVCYTSDSIRKEVTAGVLSKISNAKSKGRAIERVVVAPMDNPGCCSCRNCGKLTRSEGSYMGAQLTFVNYVADEVAKQYDDVSIMTTAYWLARKPPKTVVPRDNVEIMYCFAGCNNHPFDGRMCDENGNGYWSNNIKDSEWLEKWTTLSDRVWVWLYCGSYYWSFAQPTMLDYMRENLTYLASKGIYGIYCEGEYGYPDAFGDGYSFDLLTMYMFSKCSWNPNMTDEEFDSYVDEFLLMYYGKGYEYVRRYLEINAEATDAIDGCWCNNYDIPFDALSFDYLKEHSEEMITLIDTALSMCETDSERENLEHLAACVYWQALAVTYESDFEKGTDEARAIYTERYKRMYSWIVEYDMTYRVTIPDTDEVCDPYSWTGLSIYHKPREPKDPMDYV